MVPIGSDPNRTVRFEAAYTHASPDPATALAYATILGGAGAPGRNTEPTAVGRLFCSMASSSAASEATPSLSDDDVPPDAVDGESDPHVSTLAGEHKVVKE